MPSRFTETVGKNKFLSEKKTLLIFVDVIKTFNQLGLVNGDLREVGGQLFDNSLSKCTTC